MKLSELVYQVVKNVKYLEDTGFTYEAFVKGDYDSDQDYANSINNAFAPINEAIHRLSDRNKIRFQMLCLGTRSGMCEYDAGNHPVKKIKSVFSVKGSDYCTVGYREFGKGKIIILGDAGKNPVYIQYIEDIKHFRKGDFDEDLSEYGINEDMCSYIIEYSQGKLQEPIAPELANMHVTRAEQYFDDLDEQQTPFAQKNVTKRYRI